MLESLDNPIWSALTTEHGLLARSHRLARRYPPDVSPLAAFLHPTEDAFADLQRLVSPGEHVAFFIASPFDVPGGWQPGIAPSTEQRYEVRRPVRRHAALLEERTGRVELEG